MKRIISIIICVALLIGLTNGLTFNMTNVNADNKTFGTIGTDISWDYVAGTLTISGGKNAKWDDTDFLFHAPWEEYKNYNIKTVNIVGNITELPDWICTSMRNLKNVYLTDSINKMGHYCFALTAIDNIDFLPEMNTISYGTFSDCDSLKEVTIPANITYIEGRAFEQCSNLQKVIFEKGSEPINIEDKGVGVFSDCYKLSQFVVSGRNDLQVGKNGELIDDNYYDEKYDEITGDCLLYVPCNVEEYTIPSNVVGMFYDAFSNCQKIKKLTINKKYKYGLYRGGIARIGSPTMKEFVVEAGNEDYVAKDGILYRIPEKGASSYYEGARVLEQYPMGKTQESFEIPPFVSEIADHAFSVKGTRYLKDLTIPEDVMIDGQIAYAYDDSILKIHGYKGSDAYKYYEEYSDNDQLEWVNLGEASYYVCVYRYDTGEDYYCPKNKIVSTLSEPVGGTGTFLGWYTGDHLDIKITSTLDISKYIEVRGYNWIFWEKVDGKFRKIVGNISIGPKWSNEGGGDSGGHTTTAPDAKIRSAYATLNAGHGTSSIPVTIDEREFFNTSSYSYSHSLAKFSMEMSTMCYSTKKSREDLLNELGFSKIYNNDGKKDGSVSPYDIASKTVKWNGKTATIIGVFIRGTKDEEWINNFDPGTSDTHKGFNSAAQHVYNGIKKYIQDKKMTSNNIKLLITGHSRGAATSNLLGYKLDSNGISGTSISADDVYVYTYATPNTTSKSNRKDSKYKNIFNIVNPEDFVTKVLPSAWGYGRYGVTYVLPSKTTEGTGGNYVNYAYYNERISKLYSQYSPSDSKGYMPYENGMYTVSDYFSRVTSIVENINSYYESDLLVNGLSPIKSRSRSLQALYSGTMGQLMAKHNDVAYKNIGLAVPGGMWGEIGTKTIAYFIANYKLNSYFEGAHRPEMYLAAMETIQENQIKQHRKTIYGIVNCPVDVTIKDGENDVVGQIINNEIKHDEVTMAVEGESKTFMMPADSEYHIELSGNDNGTLDYSLCEVDADTGETNRVFYNDLDLTKTTKYTQNITEDKELSDLLLKDSSNNTVDADRILDEDGLGTLSAEVEVEGIGTAASKKNLSYGDYVSLEAISDENNDFLGWYNEEGDLVANGNILGFSISKNEKFIAKFTNNIVDASSIKFLKSSISVNVDEYAYNEATILPSNATYKTPIFKSSNEKIATVDMFGGVRGISNGSAIITATSEDGKVVSSYTVKVNSTNTDNSTKKVSNPSKSSIKIIKAKKKALKVTWKKVSGINGYQIQYSRKKNFKGAKTKTIKKASTTGITIKKLKSKKKYYVRIRTYKVVSGKTYQSAWSKVKSKKTK